MDERTVPLPSESPKRRDDRVMISFKRIFLKWHVIFVLIIAMTSSYLYMSNPIPNFHIETCPFCFGNDSCATFSTVQIPKSNWSDWFNRYLNVRNIHYGILNEKRVVVKQLSRDWQRLNTNVNAHALTSLLHDSTNAFTLCATVNVTRFLTYMPRVQVETLWTMFTLSVQPIVLRMLPFESGWPVPKYYGACGQFIMEEYAGEALTGYTRNWFDRADVALQLLQSAVMFTEAHDVYRFYLTDISSDNIVVNAGNRVAFVDLENLIISEKLGPVDTSAHSTQHFPDSFTLEFSAKDICSGAKSDHNYYNVCKLLLWSRAPFPMIPGGLLHSMPTIVQDEHSRVLALIERCVVPNAQNPSRGETVRELIQALEVVLAERGTYESFEF